MVLLMMDEKIAQTSPAEASVVMWHYHLSSVTSPSEPECHRRQDDWCNLTQHVTMPGLPAGKLGGGRKEGESKRTGFGKGIPHQNSRVGGGCFIFKKGPIATKARTPKIHRGRKPNRLGTNQWLNFLLKSTKDLGRPSIVKEGTQQGQ